MILMSSFCTSTQAKTYLLLSIRLLTIKLQQLVNSSIKRWRNVEWLAHRPVLPLSKGMEGCYNCFRFFQYYHRWKFLPFDSEISSMHNVPQSHRNQPKLKWNRIDWDNRDTFYACNQERIHRYIEIKLVSNQLHTVKSFRKIWWPNLDNLEIGTPSLIKILTK